MFLSQFSLLYKNNTFQAIHPFTLFSEHGQLSKLVKTGFLGMQTQERWSPTAVFGEGCKPLIVIQSRVLPFSSTHIPSFPILGVRDNPSVIAARHHTARVTHSRRPNLVFPSSCAVTTCDPVL